MPFSIVHLYILPCRNIVQHIPDQPMLWAFTGKLLLRPDHLLDEIVQPQDNLYR